MRATVTAGVGVTLVALLAGTFVYATDAVGLVDDVVTIPPGTLTAGEVGVASFRLVGADSSHIGAVVFAPVASLEGLSDTVGAYRQLPDATPAQARPVVCEATTCVDGEARLLDDLRNAARNASLPGSAADIRVLATMADGGKVYAAWSTIDARLPPEAGAPDTDALRDVLAGLTQACTIVGEDVCRITFVQRQVDGAWDAGRDAHGTRENAATVVGPVGWAVTDFVGRAVATGGVYFPMTVVLVAAGFLVVGMLLQEGAELFGHNSVIPLPPLVTLVTAGFLASRMDGVSAVEEARNLAWVLAWTVVGWFVLYRILDLGGVPYYSIGMTTLTLLVGAAALFLGLRGAFAGGAENLVPDFLLTGAGRAVHATIVPALSAILAFSVVALVVTAGISLLGHLESREFIKDRQIRMLLEGKTVGGLDVWGVITRGRHDLTSRGYASLVARIYGQGRRADKTLWLRDAFFVPIRKYPRFGILVALRAPTPHETPLDRLWALHQAAARKARPLRPVADDAAPDAPAPP